MEIIECVATDKQVVKTTCQVQRLLVVVVSDFRLRNNLFATVETVGRYTMPQVRFSGCRVDRHRGFLQLVVRTT
jgi:hypothetical protein